MPIPKETSIHTYQDYLTWDDDERWELIDGRAYNMSPAPSVVHQIIARKIVAFLEREIEGKACIPMMAPTDVVLSEHDVVQPDVFVVCDREKIPEKCIQGAPDLVIEVLSELTKQKDRIEKKNLYEKFGVKEYLIVDWKQKQIEQYVLNQDNRYAEPNLFGINDSMPLRSLPEISLSLSEVFDLGILS